MPSDDESHLPEQTALHEATERESLHFSREAAVVTQEHIADHYVVEYGSGDRYLDVYRWALNSAMSPAILASLIACPLLMVAVVPFFPLIKGLGLAWVTPQLLFGLLSVPFVAAIGVFRWLAPNRHLEFLLADAPQSLFMRVLEDRTCFGWNVNFRLENAESQYLGHLRCPLWQRLLQPVWFCSDESDELLFVASEGSVTKSFFGRVLGFLLSMRGVRRTIVLRHDSGEVARVAFDEGFLRPPEKRSVDLTVDPDDIAYRRYAIALAMVILIYT